MSKRINMVAGAAINGGALGVLTTAGNPWLLPDVLANELVNRGVAVMIDVDTPAVAPLVPSGDVTGAADTALLAPLLASGKDISLGDGDWYFNDTLVRMPRRNASGTDWAYTTLLGRTTDALLPDFIGTGSRRCRLHFTDASKPGIYVWRPPSGIANGPAANVRQRANSADISRDPLTAGGGRTGGFSLMGAAVFAVAGTVFDLDNEALYPNNIGLAVWGSTNYHDLFDIQFSNWGIGCITHDLTGGTGRQLVFRNCDVGLAQGIQSDSNRWTDCWHEFCRVGLALEWDGWQTGTGRAATFAGIGRESNGLYIAYGSGNDADGSTFDSCFYVQCSMAAVAGHHNPANTFNSSCYGAVFNTPYFEANGSVMYGFRNINQGSVVMNNPNFRNLCPGGDVVGSYIQGGAKTGGASEQLRHWIVSRFGVTQAQADNAFASFWSYGGATATGQIVLRNPRFDGSPYPLIQAPGSTAVIWEGAYQSQNGSTLYPTIYANLLNAATKGYCVNSTGTFTAAGVPWNFQGTIDWGTYVIQDGFAKDSRGDMVALSSAVALPGASAAYRGQRRTLIGAPGTRDTTYVCLKSAANAYSWVAVGDGGA